MDSLFMCQALPRPTFEGQVDFTKTDVELFEDLQF